MDGDIVFDLQGYYYSQMYVSGVHVNIYIRLVEQN